MMDGGNKIKKRKLKRFNIIHYDKLKKLEKKFNSIKSYENIKWKVL